MKKSVLALLAIVALSACSGPETVSFDTLESSRTKAKENAVWNATQYRAAAGNLNEYSIDAMTDSSMVATCPQGDGWVSVKLVNNTNPASKIGLKCSTVSNAIGCLSENDFKGKSFAGDDGSCQPVTKVPFPTPTLKK